MLESVPANFRAIAPDLPIPVTTIRPGVSQSRRHARVNSGSLMRAAHSEIATPSSARTRLASATRAAESASSRCCAVGVCMESERGLIAPKLMQLEPPAETKVYSIILSRCVTAQLNDKRR